jgi:hypothetical protein
MLMWVFCIVHSNVMNSRPSRQSTVILAQLKRSQVGNSILSFTLGLPFSSEFIRITDLRQLYHDFDNIYRRHVDEAKFEVVEATAFRTLKQRLTPVLQHLKEHPRPGSRKRTELIQAFLSVDDLRHAEQVPLKSDTNKEPVKSHWFQTVTIALNPLTWFKGTNESPRKEAWKITSNISDSEFLRELKVIQDKDLADLIHEAMALAHSSLSSSIDNTVTKMTRAVLQMQQEECKRSVKREIEAEERSALDDIRVGFIRDVNQQSAGRRTSAS